MPKFWRMNSDKKWKERLIRKWKMGGKWKMGVTQDVFIITYFRYFVSLVNQTKSFFPEYVVHTFLYCDYF